jgi:lipopolysaccharide export system protein LptA
MKESATLTEQISLHFDTAAATAELAATLATDPAAAQAFARAARTEALLEKTLGTPMKPKLIRHPWRWASIAAVLVAAGLVGVKFWSEDMAARRTVVNQSEFTPNAAAPANDPGPTVPPSNQRPAVDLSGSEPNTQSKANRPIPSTSISIDSNELWFSKDEKTAEFKGAVRLRSEDCDIDCETLTVKLPPEPPSPMSASLKDSGMELHAKSAKDGTISFVRKGNPESRGTCKEMDFDPVTGILTLRGFPTLESHGNRLEGTDATTIFKIDRTGTVNVAGPVRTTKGPAKR